MNAAAVGAFGWAARALADRRAASTPSVGAPDWMCLEALTAIALLPGPPPRLLVQLRDGIPARTVGRCLRHGPGRGLALAVHRGPPARTQAAAVPGLTLGRTQEVCTATALVRDRLNAERHYLLTCGHGVAPDAAVRYGDRVQINADQAGSQDGALCEWLPDPAAEQPASRIDAALVEIDAGVLQALRSAGDAWWPRTLDDQVQVGRPVSLQRHGSALGGTLAMPWAGEVTTDRGLSYLLQEGYVYQTATATVGGDSGAALWTEGDALLGMHVGLLDHEPGRPANALMARVKPALDWYCVKPFTRLDPATIGPADWPPLPLGQAPAPGRVAAAPAVAVPVVAGIDPDDHRVLAQTLWGEARGEGPDGMQAVAAVVMNRARSGYRGKHRAADVCRDPQQFSCWNVGDPNAEAMRRVAADGGTDAAFRTALDIAATALRGSLIDPTFGSRHYVATTLRFPPDWLRDKTPIVVIGRHAFYNDVA